MRNFHGVRVRCKEKPERLRNQAKPHFVFVKEQGGKPPIICESELEFARARGKA